MSDLTFLAATAAAPVAPREAIARAAQRTGVDFDFLLAQARLESGLDPSARARTSSAAGLYQFTRSTWLDTLRKHGPEHGLGWASEAAADPARRAQVLALRHEPQVAALMAAELAGDNRAALSATLGREPDHAELYLAHFLGSGGASRFLSALAADPSQSAAALMPDAARANRAIFLDGTGTPRSVGGVMELIRGRMARAANEAAPGSADYGDSDFAVASARWPGRAPAGLPAAIADVPTAPRASMADTLRQAFNVGGSAGSGIGDGPPSHVTYAYRRLSALGL